MGEQSEAQEMPVRTPSQRQSASLQSRVQGYVFLLLWAQLPHQVGLRQLKREMFCAFTPD